MIDTQRLVGSNTRFDCLGWRPGHMVRFRVQVRVFISVKQVTGSESSPRNTLGLSILP